jgi:hypothetical protein
VAPPTYDPACSARVALAEFDADHDGTLTGSELDPCPGLRAAAARVDTNGDKKLSGDELKSRFASYAAAPFAATGVAVRVLLNGSPVVGATVTFTPERCLGESALGGTGTTDDRGVTTLTRADGVPGLAAGVYRVSVSGGGVPSDYSVRPLLGHEVSADPRGGSPVELKLSSRPK